MNHIFVWVATWNDENFTQKKHLIHSLPIHLQNEIHKFKFPEDQNQSLVSKVLLKKMLNTWGYDFKDLHYVQNQKPYIHYPQKPPFFSYSKSIGKVVLVWSWQTDVGIDIEYFHRKTEWKIFQSRLSPSIWAKISNDSNPLNTFLWCWTHIEAIIKLKAIGLANHIKLVEYIDKQWFFENQKIYTQSFNNGNHLITLACHEPFNYEIQEFYFE
jgi:phosphopantetheinyl transferase